MAEFIPVSLIKNNLTECPICTEQFEEEVRIPRRMPCCVQSICQPSLETYSRGQKKVPCPMCRCEHLLPGGVTSLAKEPLILRILEQLKIQKGVKIPCTNCPDKNNAVARCEDCCVSLCEECLRAHRRVQALNNHNVKTFEELKHLPIENVKRVHHCEEHRHPLEFYCTTCDKVICVSCTVLEHEKGDNHSVMSISKAHKERSEEMNAFLTKLEEKALGLTESVRKLEMERDAFKDSSVKAKENVSNAFDSLIAFLELKKAIQLSKLDHKTESYLKLLQGTTENAKTILKQVRSSTDYTRNMRRKADEIEDIQLISSAMPSLNAVNEKQVEDLKSIDIENEVDATRELTDLLNTYIQQQLSTVPSVEQQRDELQELLKTPLKEGDSWYLVGIKWSNHLRSYLGLKKHWSNGPITKPGPIDNEPLLADIGSNKYLSDFSDYHAYPKEAWYKLVSWYGVVDNQIPIRRKVIKDGWKCRLEVKLMKFELGKFGQTRENRIGEFSRADTIGHLEMVLRSEFGIAVEKYVRLWRVCEGFGHTLIESTQQTLHVLDSYKIQTIIIEEMNEDGSWPMTLEKGRKKTPEETKEKLKKRGKKMKTYYDDF